MLVYELPLNEIVLDFYDRLKSVSRGYASLDYHLSGYKESKLVKLDILVSGEPVDALSLILHTQTAAAKGRLAGRPGSPLDRIAESHDATPRQIALAWLLRRSPVMLPIPGTSSVAHLEENLAAAAIRLSTEEFETLAGAY